MFNTSVNNKAEYKPSKVVILLLFLLLFTVEKLFASEEFIKGGNLELFFSEYGKVSSIQSAGDTIPLYQGKELIYLLDMGEKPIAMLTGESRQLTYYEQKWINYTALAEDYKARHPGYTVYSETSERSISLKGFRIDSAGKIRISLFSLIKGEKNSFLEIIVVQHGAENKTGHGTELKSFRVRTGDADLNSEIKKNFYFSPEFSSESFDVILKASKGLNLFSCKSLLISAIGDNDYLPVFAKTVYADENKISFAGEQKNFKIECDLTSQKEYISVSGKVSATDKKDSAVVIRFSLPVQADGMRWFDTLSKWRIIKNDDVCSNWHKLGNERYFSVYPYSSLIYEKKGISYAVPLESPRIFRIGCSEKEGYYIEFDLGLSEATEKFPSSASFNFIIYSHEAEWGMRDAARKYFSFFPQYFVKRNLNEGIWFAWNDRNKIKWPHDFGLMFDSTCGETIGFDSFNEINFFYYQEPFGTGISWKDENPKISIPENIPYRDILNKIMEQSLSREKIFRTLRGDVNFVDASIKSAVKDEDGLYYIGRYKPYLFANPDPELPFGKLNIDAIRFWQEKTPLSARPYYGQYIDSIVPWWWAIREDYNKENFRMADMPLTFSYDTGKPVELGIMPAYELFSEIAELTRGYGGLVLGNTWAPVHTFCINQIDIVGAGEYTTDQPMEHFHYLRALSYQKTISFIDRELVDKELTEREIEKRFNKCLAFGVFPGTYPFREPERYNKLREKYKKYIPLIRLVSGAGWEPVTHAAASHPSLAVERFGGGGENLYFTIYNPSQKKIDFTFEIDRTKLGMNASDKYSAFDIINNTSSRLHGTANKLYLSMSIEADDVILILAGNESQSLSSKLRMAVSAIDGFEKHRVTEKLSTNMLKSLNFFDPRSGRELLFTSKRPDIDSLKIENKEGRNISELRLPWQIDKNDTDYIYRLNYYTEETGRGSQGALKSVYCLLYSAARFLSGKALPDVTVSNILIDSKGKVNSVEKMELQSSTKEKIFENYFFVPSDVTSLNLLFRVEGDFNRLFIKDVRIYPAGFANTVEEEMRLVNEINALIEEFYGRNRLSDRIIGIASELSKGENSIDAAEKELMEIKDLLNQHKTDISYRNEKLRAKNENVDEYVQRLNGFITLLESF